MSDVAGPCTSAGRSGVIVRNVACNWLWFSLVMVSGLIVPRFIAGRQGKELLGVWDLGWSMTFYVGLFSLGLTSAVTRFVARTRAQRDWAGLNAVVNTGLAVMLAGSMLGALFSFGLAALAPYVLSEADAATRAAAYQVILILSIASALQLPGTIFGGVITGCERYDLLNLVRGILDALVLAAMILLLTSGYGLLALAWLLLVVEVPSFFARAWMARRLCPMLRFSPSCVRWRTAREMVSFSGKTCAQVMANSGLYQLNGILVSSFLGPAVLAVYSRQRVLVLQALRFIRQYAQVFIPSSSACHATGDTAGLRRLLVSTSRYGMYFTLPVVILLLFMGRPIVDLWMKPGYAAPGILAIMALGHLPAVAQQGAYMVLMGMGRHGAPAVFEGIAAALGVLLAVVLMSQGLGMTGAALAMAVPVALSGGVALPLYACRLLGQNFSTYLGEITLGPLLVNLPFAACLALARYVFADAPLRGLGAGLVLGGVVNAIVYWRWILPAVWRQRLLARLGLGRQRPSEAPTAALPAEAVKA